MNEKVLHTLEFDKIRNILADKCGSDFARQTALRLSPIAKEEKIIKWQNETGDALERILKKGSLAFINPPDTKSIAKHLSIGGTLSIVEILAIANLLRASKRIKSYGISERLDAPTDSLSDDFSNIDSLDSVTKEIERCIISEDEISDDASSNLSSIRRQIKITASSVHDKLQSLLNSLRDYLQEPVITQRNGRYCLPVTAGNKSKVPGMVHDQSSSGQTLFIEPMAVVELNNKLRQLQIDEADEIEVILSKLSLLISDNIDAILLNHNIIVKLDFIFAKAALALDMNAFKPNISDKGIVILKEARHPLLDKNKCVPINILLGEKYNLLIVTGPNTGGKTVSLKTLGLLCIMAQSGLHIPASSESQIPVFYYIGADIGDEQSIEQSLSTFSSHMVNINRIINDMKKGKWDSSHCLVLFDELCAGTDPSEGAALATSILDFLQKKGVRLMATTHYSELKAYAITKEGVENASMEFDIETLSPTYHLIIGAPGKSNAFAISKKLGISDEIIDDAKMRLSDNDLSVEELLSNLEIRRKEIEIAKEQIANDKAEIARLRESIEKKQASIEKSRNEIIEKANIKASNILKDAKNTADAAIRNINKYGSKDVDLAKLEKNRSNLGKKLKGTIKNSSTKAVTIPVRPGKAIVSSEISIGDRVHVLSMDLDATIISLPNKKNEVEVQIGSMRTRIKVQELVTSDSPTEEPKKTSVVSHSASLNKAFSISPEIKLLGMTGDEAIAELGKYLDDAYMAKLSSVRIVHGKGSGVLRQAVSDYLRKNPIIKSYRLAEYGEGDTGVTIAEFK